MSFTREQRDVLIKLAYIPKELREYSIYESTKNIASLQKKVEVTELFERAFAVIDMVIIN